LPSVLLGLVSCSVADTGTSERPLGGDGSVVREWHRIATDTISLAAPNTPPAAGVLIPIVQLAVYDAVVAIEGGYQPYSTALSSPGASVDAAVAQSAHDVLVELVPSQAAALDAELADTLGAVPDGPAKDAGIAVGQAAAAGMLANRENDGRFGPFPYVLPPAGPGAYQPTPPAFSTNLLSPWVAQVRPFLMTSLSQFRPGPPLDITKKKWADQYDEVKEIGAIDSTVRTPWQSEVAVFWTEHAARHWNRNLRAQAEREALNDLETARLLAMTNAAMADGWIGCWEAKFHYSFWRPVTAIRQGDTDGRADTDANPTWTPFVVTPPQPEYPGGHGCVSVAASDAARAFFGSNHTDFPMEATVGGVTYVHHFTHWTHAGEAAKNARLWGGIHYDYSNDEGGKIGRRVVEWMLASGYFSPVP
jgi:hypothetical protein